MNEKMYVGQKHSWFFGIDGALKIHNFEIL